MEATTIRSLLTATAATAALALSACGNSEDMATKTCGVTTTGAKLCDADLAAFCKASENIGALSTDTGTREACDAVTDH